MRISVVIPMYNCEKFIGELFECLYAQTMSDFEVIFVDDCSTDTTSVLLKEVVKQNPNFFYYRNEKRQGAAISRNIGIRNSTAPYVLCLDADDRFENDLLEQVTNAAYDNDADMVMLERNDFYGFDAHTIRRKRYMFEDEKIFFFPKTFILEHQPIDFLLRCENGTCDRLVRRTLLDEYQIRFQNLKNSNDVFYILFATFCAKKIVHTATFDNLYHRRVHAEQGRISNQRDPMCAYLALKEVHDKLVEYGKWEQYCVHFWMFALDSLEKQLLVCKDMYRQKEVYEYIQREGLLQLGIEVDEYYERLPEAVRRQYHKFCEMAYGEKCYEKSMMLEALCELYAERIALYCNRMKGKKVAFWGAGKFAPVFISAYRKQGGQIDLIIDNDTNKQGGECAGCPIVSFEDVSGQVDAIIISNRRYYSEIGEQIAEKSRNIDIYSMQEILFT